MEFLSDGEEVRVEVERFVSNGQIENEAALAELFQNFSDAEEPVADHAIAGK
jgi:hypothetical protein